MEEYIDAGSYVIGLCFMLWGACSTVVLIALIIAFITDTQARMPPLLREFIPFRDEYRCGPDPISWFVLFQTVGVGLLITIASMFLWPVYIALAVLFTTRAMYRHREGIMMFFRAIANSRMASPVSMLREEKKEEPLKGVGVNSVDEPRWARPPPEGE